MPPRPPFHLIQGIFQINVPDAELPTRAFETRGFYLTCFLRCMGYDLIDLRAEGRRKVFVFRDRSPSLQPSWT